MTERPAAGGAARLTRLLALVPWLRTHPGVRIDQAAAAFGITPKQLRADVELLFLCGLPGGSPGDLIDIDLDGDAITLLDPQTLDRPLRLTADEGNALLVAVRALADVPGIGDREVLERLRAKLETATAGTAHGGAPVAVAVEDPGHGVLPVLREAVDAARRVHLSYLGAGREQLTERDVDPMRVVLREGRWYFEGWCHRAEAVRLFRADRIEAVTLLDTPSTPPPDAVPRDLADGLFRPSADHLLAELALAPAAHWVADQYPCEHVSPQPDGTLHAGLRTADAAWLVTLVLRLGGAARVVAPAELAAEVRDRAERALAAYEHDDDHGDQPDRG